MIRAIALGLLLAGPAAAFDPFEIQIYDGSASPPGVFGLELHLNYVPKGLQGAGPPLLDPHQQFHFTFEPSYGVTNVLEVGGYLQFALLPDGTARTAGAKLRAKVVTPEGFLSHWRLGMNFELSRMPLAFSDAQWAGELRPIISWEDERFLVAANPSIALVFSGDDRRPSFEPGVMGKVKLGRIAAGFEYYGSTGPIAAFAPLHEQEHYLFGAVDLLGVERLELNLGAGAGLTAGSNDFILKAIVGWTFE